MSEQPEKRGVFGGYSDEHRPLASYATLAGIFNLLFAAVLLLARASGRKIPGNLGLSDLATFGVATHKLSWLIAKDAVTSPLRAPFTRLEEVESPTSVQESPRGRGFQLSTGELLTCHFCVGQWVAAFFAYGLIFAPAVTRFIGAIFTILTISDHLHQTYHALLKRA